ncbi:hypothetical protein FB451DRAFT_1084875, partial [Mycena latifolia]
MSDWRRRRAKQIASKSDGWDTEPFVLTQEPDGRESSDDKGPVLGWVNVLQWHEGAAGEPRVGMEKNGSEGLDELGEREKDGWIAFVSCVSSLLFLRSDNYWLNTRTPALAYGLCGLAHRLCPARDLHSGVFGRTVHEPVTGLVVLLPLADRAERGQGAFLSFPSPLRFHCARPPLFSRFPFHALRARADAPQVQVLMGLMCLSLHGIEGAFAGPGAKTGIPAKAGGKFPCSASP